MKNQFYVSSSSFELFAFTPIVPNSKLKIEEPIINSEKSDENSSLHFIDLNTNNKNE